jgi:hypothetical protein
MNTQDPYRELSAMKHREEYPGYEDFVPYRNDWRYGLSFFSLLMIAGIAFSYWQLQPDVKLTTATTTPIAKVVTSAANPAQDSALKQPAAPKAIVAPKAITKPTTSVHGEPAKAIQPQAKPEPIQTVTAPPSY